jgi:cytochrome c oxidase subunit III
VAVTASPAARAARTRRELASGVQPEGFEHPSGLPRAPAGSRTGGWWGLLVGLVSLSGVTGSLVYAYFFLSQNHDFDWPQGGIELPDLVRGGALTALLVVTAAVTATAAAAGRRDRPVGLRVGLMAAFVLGLAYLVLQGVELAGQPFRIDTNAYAAIYTMNHLFHGTLVATGLVMSLVVQWRSAIDARGGVQAAGVEILSLWWGFVATSWLFVFAAVYVWPHLR